MSVKRLEFDSPKLKRLDFLDMEEEDPPFAIASLQGEEEEPGYLGRHALFPQKLTPTGNVPVKLEWNKTATYSPAPFTKQ
jgi:hypothetical protein